MKDARLTIASLCALVALVTIAYANHFQNVFHFDDMHTVVENPYIRDLHYLPRFFTDAGTFSVNPWNSSWRPLVSASLAIDYWLGGGLKPLFFHVSTFFWLLVQVLLIYALALKIFNLTRPDPRNQWVAWFAAALYGVHPAGAETVNYVIQRGDLYSTLGVVAGVVVYAYAPGLRKWGLYLVPVVAAMLSKPPAVVFPAILFAYIWFFEEEDPRRAAIRSLPALVVTGALAVLSIVMTPTTFVTGAISPAQYRLTQPLVALRYFRNFLLPLYLSADTDHVPATGLFDGGAWLGFVFLAVLIAVTVLCARKREWRPVAFGLIWFGLALVTTSLIPLAEVENDHRMFFPFVGLAIAASWTLACVLYRHPVNRIAVVAVAGIALAALVWGTWQRNRVWRDQESFWYDVTLKSPTNSRGLLNYGIAQMNHENFYLALDYFKQALVYKPGYPDIERNLGVVYAELHRDDEAQRHFVRALQVAPGDAQAHYDYGAWLMDHGHVTEGIKHLNMAVDLNPANLNAWHTLLDAYGAASDAEGVRRSARALLALFPSDGEAKVWLDKARALKPTPELYASRSATAFQGGKFAESVDAAQAAIALRPDYAEAWNNLAVAEFALGQRDLAIHAEEQAVRFKPDFQAARANLANLRLQK